LIYRQGNRKSSQSVGPPQVITVPGRTDRAAGPAPENPLLPKTKCARSDDVPIDCQVKGDGPVDVVMAPGTMSHLDLDWEIPR